MVSDFSLLNKRTTPDIIAIRDLKETIEQLCGS